MTHSVLQGISPTLKYWPQTFLPKPSKKIPNLSDPSFMSNPLKILENFISPPPLWNVPSSKIGKTHFLKKKKILFPAMK